MKNITTWWNSEFRFAKHFSSALDVNEQTGEAEVITNKDVVISIAFSAGLFLLICLMGD